MEKKKEKKVAKIVIIIVFIIFALFMINTIRKLILIKDIQKNVKQYTQSTNYHISAVSSQTNGTTLTINSYRKANKKFVSLERIENNESIAKISLYDTGEKKTTFFESHDSKKVELNSHATFIMEIFDYFDGQSNMELLCSSIDSSIKTTNYNGKDCYVISNSFWHLIGSNSDLQEIYIEKDTGLILKTQFGDSISERKYEFDNVPDTVFIEPDISQYELIENN